MNGELAVLVDCGWSHVVSAVNVYQPWYMIGTLQVMLCVAVSLFMKRPEK